MFEAADARDFRMLALSLPQKKEPCPHCGSTNPHPVNYLWRNESGAHFGCCVQALVENHSADPARVIKQGAPSFIAD
ncbi:MAG: hypothetical protein ACEQSB_02800 [Undibacterium sp.]